MAQATPSKLFLSHHCDMDTPDWIFTVIYVKHHEWGKVYLDACDWKTVNYTTKLQIFCFLNLFFFLLRVESRWVLKRSYFQPTAVWTHAGESVHRAGLFESHTWTHSPKVTASLAIWRPFCASVPHCTSNQWTETRRSTLCWQGKHLTDIFDDQAWTLADIGFYPPTPIEPLLTGIISIRHRPESAHVEQVGSRLQHWALGWHRWKHSSNLPALCLPTEQIWLVDALVLLFVNILVLIFVLERESDSARIS